MEQLSLDPRAWSNLPTPKVRRGDRIGVYSWSKFYSAFSERFALAALRLLGPPEEGVVLDPFCGIGTTLIAAAKLGYPATGVDLDPFSALLARTAIATQASGSNVLRILEPKQLGASRAPDVTSDPAPDLFALEDWQYAAGILQRTLGETKDAAAGTWHQLLREVGRVSDSETVALAALGLAAGQAANLAQGSNPVWHRRSEPGERSRSVSLHALAVQIADRLLTDLREAEGTLRTNDITLINKDIEAFTVPPRPIDIVLTSPPYLNRLDYVVNHLAPLSIFSPFLRFDLEALRKQMLGTTKIVTKSGEPRPEWGEAAFLTLENIRRHASKASASYYYWIYFDYFQRFFERFTHLMGMLHNRSRVLIVIQNSFYKEIEIPMPQILLEMAAALSLSGRVVRSENVRAHLGTLSPQQVAYVPSKVLREEVLLLQPAV